MKNVSRRSFVKSSTLAGLGLVVSGSASSNISGINLLTLDKHITWEQQPLAYNYNAISPAVDAQTMEIHYSKHAAGYAKNMAEAVSEENVMKGKGISSVLSTISKYSSKMRNNAGGHFNHELFWKTLRSPIDNNTPEGKLRERIITDFKSVELFQTQFENAAKSRFGSGWTWLILDNERKLKISSTPNQDNPLMDIAEVKGVPILGLDVWEHAYYLKYQNRRPEYINAWWKVVNWNFVNTLYSEL